MAHNAARTGVKAYYSPDGKTWFSFVEFPLQVEFGAYAHGNYVLANRSGLVTTSANGQSWTTPTNTSWQSLPHLTHTASGIGNIVALGSASGAGAPGLHSRDGIHWEPIVGIDGARTIRGVAFGNNRFVAVGDNGTTLISYTGKYWLPAEFVDGSDLLAVAHSPLGFVAVGRGVIFQSENGVRWKAVTNRLSMALYSIAYGDGKFVVTTSGRGARPMYSTNLTSWTNLPLDQGQFATYGNGKFLMAVGNTIQTSTDGLTWQTAPTPPWQTHSEDAYPGVLGIHFSDGYFFVRTYSQNYVSTDGVTWHKFPTTPLTTTVTRHFGRFFAVGAQGSVLESSGFARVALHRRSSSVDVERVVVRDQQFQLQTSADLHTWTDLRDVSILQLSTKTAAKFFRLKAQP